MDSHFVSGLEHTGHSLQAHQKYAVKIGIALTPFRVCIVADLTILGRIARKPKAAQRLGLFIGLSSLSSLSVKITV